MLFSFWTWTDLVNGRHKNGNRYSVYVSKINKIRLCLASLPHFKSLRLLKSISNCRLGCVKLAHDCLVATTGSESTPNVWNIFVVADYCRISSQTTLSFSIKDVVAVLKNRLKVTQDCLCCAIVASLNAWGKRNESTHCLSKVVLSFCQTIVALRSALWVAHQCHFALTSHL